MGAAVVGRGLAAAGCAAVVSSAARAGGRPGHLAILFCSCADARVMLLCGLLLPALYRYRSAASPRRNLTRQVSVRPEAQDTGQSIAVQIEGVAQWMESVRRG